MSLSHYSSQSLGLGLPFRKRVREGAVCWGVIRTRLHQSHCLLLRASEALRGDKKKILLLMRFEVIQCHATILLKILTHVISGDGSHIGMPCTGWLSPLHASNSGTLSGMKATCLVHATIHQLE